MSDPLGADGVSEVAGIDFTSLFPFEVLLHVIHIGAFSYAELADLRRVNRCLCAAASDPTCYRSLVFTDLGDHDKRLEAIPRYVASGLGRLVFRHQAATVDLGLVADLFPNLASLEVEWSAPSPGSGCRLPRFLRQLSLDVLGKDLEWDALGGLECLSFRFSKSPLPVAALANLRRLSMQDYRTCDPFELVAALSRSPCAAVLEALVLYVSLRGDTPQDWAAPLVALTNLQELALFTGCKDGTYAFDADVGLATVFPNLDALEVLRVSIPFNGRDALCRGLPSRLRALSLLSVSSLCEHVVPSLPSSLSALSIRDGTSVTPAQIRALLHQCPGIRAVELLCDDDAIEFLATEPVATLPRLVFGDRVRLDEGERGRLLDAGHTVASLEIKVDWRGAGSVYVDGRAVAWW